MTISSVCKNVGEQELMHTAGGIKLYKCSKNRLDGYYTLLLHFQILTQEKWKHISIQRSELECSELFCLHSENLETTQMSTARWTYKFCCKSIQVLKLTINTGPFFDNFES